ncbi:LpqB family beta-propeller domain-containing protein [Streptomyces sp. PT12]|uniref:LpqB family beta-propeller domain-containing protein n=1 Tax=Streptomyces sp. PT12 TaxID=1510197 RepID=UPI000DE4FDEB|nr:LpqB family beta-propeller domain-containing protein [Streptomyces sp. PT12]RBM21478.1 hypothetical protein DEH69_06230 [Streptomyces sp. PT12]
MGTDRIRRRAAAGLLSAGLLLTGCASMPDSGPVQSVDSSEASDADAQVLVYGVPPEEGMLPQQIVRGFLEAVTSDDPDYEMAKRYLTPRGAEEWDPFFSTTVLASGPRLSGPAGEGERVELSGLRLATVDGAHGYDPRAGTYTASFELEQVDGEWRIDALPDGVVMGEADFRRIYRSADTFYYADLGGEWGRPADETDVLVPDPVYVRSRIDPVRDVIEALLDGPSEWQAPVVSTMFPDGAALADGQRPAIDDSGRLTVRLTGVPEGWSRDSCERMASQLLHTVRDLASAEVTEVRLRTESGASLCGLDDAAAQETAPGALDGEVSRAYFLGETGRLTSLAQRDGTSRPVSGAFGDENAGLRSAAVSRDGDLAAGVSADGSVLDIAPLGAGGTRETALTSDSSGENAGLSAPSWDGLGDLWVADRDPDAPRLLRLTGGEGAAREIPVQGLAPGERIQAVRVAPDGVRIVALVSDGEATSLQMGRVERTSGPEGETVRVAALREVAPRLVDVVAVSWAGSSTLVVVGRPADGVQQVQYLAIDGSSTNLPTVPGLNQVVEVAASEDSEQPLLAQIDAGIVRLDRDDPEWKLVLDGGAEGYAPVYPG